MRKIPDSTNEQFDLPNTNRESDLLFFSCDHTTCRFVLLPSPHVGGIREQEADDSGYLCIRSLITAGSGK